MEAYQVGCDPGGPEGDEPRPEGIQHIVRQERSFRRTISDGPYTAEQERHVLIDASVSIVAQASEGITWYIRHEAEERGGGEGE